MNFSFKEMFLFHFVFISFVLNCAAFPDVVTSKERKTLAIKKEKVKIVFTGFYRYDEEKNVITEILQREGITFDPHSKYALEVILQKKEPHYRFLWIHRLNFVLTFLSGGIVPSHIRTESTLTFRYSNLGQVEKEYVYDIGMDQWRGIPVFVFMVTHWPNRIYKEQLMDATRLELKEI
ncbi:hypothetical protein NUH30_07875 [Leptospira sp. 85282-16]|uniref:hypothetical protein n=1 Tax=Leptospira sp. 85282-16 TaxID=2971256 RepID=UPI0021C01F0A|nr:hypothetical protein [Leptospira sp. 85282-16]MCT8333587.1 hypothetical protein [Leptospira sp. 85282-16]